MVLVSGGRKILLGQAAGDSVSHLEWFSPMDHHGSARWKSCRKSILIRLEASSVAGVFWALA
jgi:hypothetical protein